jgi:hypothetical protein
MAESSVEKSEEVRIKSPEFTKNGLEHQALAHLESEIADSLQAIYQDIIAGIDEKGHSFEINPQVVEAEDLEQLLLNSLEYLQLKSDDMFQLEDGLVADLLTGVSDNNDQFKILMECLNFLFERYNNFDFDEKPDLEFDFTSLGAEFEKLVNKLEAINRLTKTLVEQYENFRNEGRLQDSKIPNNQTSKKFFSQFAGIDPQIFRQALLNAGIELGLGGAILDPPNYVELAATFDLKLTYSKVSNDSEEKLYLQLEIEEARESAELIKKIPQSMQREFGHYLSLVDTDCESAYQSQLLEKLPKKVEDYRLLDLIILDSLVFLQSDRDLNTQGLQIASVQEFDDYYQQIKMEWLKIAKNSEMLSESRYQFSVFKIRRFHESSARNSNHFKQIVFEKFEINKEDKAKNQIIAWIWNYSKEYDLDPLLVAAISYHESGFNSKADNPGSSAYGAMQLLVGTFSDDLTRGYFKEELVDDLRKILQNDEDYNANNALSIFLEYESAINNHRKVVEKHDEESGEFIKSKNRLANAINDANDLVAHIYQIGPEYSVDVGVAHIKGMMQLWNQKKSSNNPMILPELMVGHHRGRGREGAGVALERIRKNNYHDSNNDRDRETNVFLSSVVSYYNKLNTPKS